MVLFSKPIPQMKNLLNKPNNLFVRTRKQQFEIEKIIEATLAENKQ